MEKYDYNQAIYNDVKNEINDSYSELVEEWRNGDIDRQDIEDKLNDELWTNDNVTGNGSGSYFCNAWKAGECVAHNWDLLSDALSIFGNGGEDTIEHGEEWADVTIRCYLLPDSIRKALDEIEDTFEEEEDDDQDDNEE